MTAIYNFFAALFLSTAPVNELPKEPVIETQSEVCIPMPIGDEGDFECVDPYGMG
ncbi:hypothetical protein [Pseudoalteromonas phenolica]|uniref:hypothetical protein n=1 Tax=Pseudoalteromonas phenolica TaxID=161398 RepID=UPI0014872CF7|nr:hypothetical protein [Pseudoalteromonas phenolica]